MAESKAPTPAPDPPKPSAATPVAPPIGTIVLVRSSYNTLVPAIVTNDFAGQNAAGAAALVVFNSASFDNQPVKVIQSAQAETFEIDAETLSRELFMWYQPMGSSLAERNLQKEIDDKRNKPAE